MAIKIAPSVAKTITFSYFIKFKNAAKLLLYQ
jgi:hypothetical protein